MNSVCTDPEWGKCVCYEDKEINNPAATPEYRDINGSRVKKGFDLLNYSKKRCEEVVDACMENRRNITQKYETSVRRDCLKLSEIASREEKGLKGELKTIKSCMRDFCTAYIGGEVENFNFPEFGLCFTPSYADFILDSYCQEPLASTSAPMALRALLMDELDWKREQSCKKMSGQLTADRQKCMITINYGPTKDTVQASKKIPAGDYFSCKAADFGVEQDFTDDYKREQNHAAMRIAASGIRAGTSIAGTAMGGSLLASVVDGGFELAAGVATMVVNEKKIKEAEEKGDTETAKAMKDARMGSVLSLAMSAAGVGMSVKGGMKGGFGGAAAASVGGTIMKVVGSVISVGAQGVDMYMKHDIAKQTKEMEEKGLIRSQVSREAESGVLGSVAETVTVRGNCYINNEWFATEGEVMIINWTL
jgi:hypothetical protein